MRKGIKHASAPYRVVKTPFSTMTTKNRSLESLEGNGINKNG